MGSDAMTDTGWTLTMAARVVRSAGAPAVPERPVAWSSLTSDQQRVLSRFEGKWNELPAQRQLALSRGAQKWLSMSPDERVQQARSVVRNATVAEQLVMAAILLADEMQEARAGSGPADALAPELAEVVAARLEALADKLENLARRA